MTALLAVLMTTANLDASPVTLTDPGAEAALQARQSADEIVVTGARTEGSSDYTIPGQTTATRLNLTLRETPQSVSVVTRAQIEDFNSMT